MRGRQWSGGGKQRGVGSRPGSAVDVGLRLFVMRSAPSVPALALKIPSTSFYFLCVVQRNAQPQKFQTLNSRLPIPSAFGIRCDRTQSIEV